MCVLCPFLIGFRSTTPWTCPQKPAHRSDGNNDKPGRDLLKTGHLQLHMMDHSFA